MVDVRAKDLRLVNAFKRLDLPTFDRPAKAISGKFGLGKEAESTADVT